MAEPASRDDGPAFIAPFSATRFDIFNPDSESSETAPAADRDRFPFGDALERAADRPKRRGKRK